MILDNIIFVKSFHTVVFTCGLCPLVFHSATDVANMPTRSDLIEVDTKIGVQIQAVCYSKPDDIYSHPQCGGLFPRIDGTSKQFNS